MLTVSMKRPHNEPVETEMSKKCANVDLSHAKPVRWDEHTYIVPQDEPTTNQEVSEEFKVFDNIILNFIKEQRIPGASLCIGHDGQIVYCQTYGWASLNTPVRPENRFRIASITKALTAAGIMNLVERRLLKLQDKVFGPKGILPSCIPGLKGDRRVLKITVKHLLQHSGGWDRDEVGDPVFWRHVGKEMNVPEPVPQIVLIQYMMNQKLQFSPGTKHVYSNFGYCVLGRVIEKVTGESYEKYIMGLLHSVDITNMKVGRTQRHLVESDEVEYFAGLRCNFVDSIYASDGRVPAPYGGFAMETGDADGGWIATAKNLVQFFQALDGTVPKQFLSAKSFKAMTERPSYMKGSSSWYGFGLDVSWNRKAWEHSGTLDGATSSLVRDNTGYIYAMLCNYWPEDSDYTSVVSYAMKHVTHWNKLKKATVPDTDAATLDKHYAISLRVPRHEFLGQLQTMDSQGYSASWLVANQFKGSTYFSVIWTNTKSAVEVLHEAKESDLTKICNNDKVGVEHIDSYVIDNQIHYCIIYSETNQARDCQKVVQNVPLNDVNEVINRQKKDNMIVTRLSIASIKTESLATILFRRQDMDTNHWVKTGLNSASYQSNFNKHSRYGHMMTYVKPYYNCSDQLFFSTVWTNSGSYQYTSEFEMSKYRLLDDFLFVADKGYRPLCICGYEEEDAEKFVAICIKEVPPNSVK